LNGDGHEDFATANTGSDNEGRETMTVLFGTGAGTFVGRQDYYAPYAPDLLGVYGLDAGDVDGDGDLDRTMTAANGIAMYYNDGDGGFTFPHRLGIYWGPFGPVYEDCDGDAVPGLARMASAPPALLTREVAIMRGLGGASAPVSVSAEPVGGPITIGPGGGSFSFRVTLTNLPGQPQSFQ